MKKFIERMREKPEHERKRFAFATSLVVTLLIAGMWTSTFFRQPQVVVENRGPFEALGDEIASAYGALKGQIAEWKNDFDNQPEGPVFDDELEQAETAPASQGERDTVSPRVTNVSIE